jgi:AraC-like DNA-binding protein
MGAGEAKRRGARMLAQWSLQLIAEAALPADRRDALLDELGLSFDVLGTPEAEIGHDATCALWERLCAGRPDDYGARFPERFDLRALGLLGYLAAASPSLGEMYGRVVRYNDLVKRPATARLGRERDHYSILEVLPAGVRPWPRPLAESILSAWLIVGRRLTAVSFDALRVRFQHAPPARPRDVANVFGCEVIYHAPVNELVLPAETWDLPLASSDPTLLRYLETLAGRLGAQSELDRARLKIAQSLSANGPPSLAGTARALGVSARTLQRRLDEHGLTYRELVDDVRRESAERLMREGTLTLEEIAYLLGFNDPSALRKARRRWRRSARGDRLSAPADL